MSRTENATASPPAGEEAIRRVSRSAEGRSGAFLWGALLASLLVPGAGFALVGRRARAIAIFACVTITFGIGVMLHSGVQEPIWKIRSEDFNLINNITFIVQLLAGLPAIASYLANLPDPPGALGALAGEPVHAWHELGGYFMIVAGAINYFAVANFHDRIVSLHPHFEAEETEPAKDDVL